MRAFIPYREFTPVYPDDLKIIRSYLESRGKLNVDDYGLDNLYREFSEDTFSAIWYKPDEYGLERFVEWLCE